MCKAFDNMINRAESKGNDEGRSLVSKLIQILLGENKIDEIDRATRDKKYQEELIKKYNLKP